MERLQDAYLGGFGGLRLAVSINRDRILAPVVVVVGLLVGAEIGRFLALVPGLAPGLVTP